MLDRPRPRRSPARYLAPLLLALVVVAIYVLVHHALGSGSGHSHRSAVHRSGHTSRPGATAAHHVATKPKYYTVKAGDSLSVISARTGVPLPTLQSLNPKAASNALQVGERLRLR